MGMTHDEIRGARQRDRLVVGSCVNRGDWEKLEWKTRIPRRYWLEKRGLDSLDVDDNNEEMIESCSQFQSHFAKSWEKGVGITVTGPPGTGKTTTTLLAAVDVAKAGFMVRFLPMAELLDLMQRQFSLSGKHATESQHKEWTDNDWLIECCRYAAHLLVLDDVGKEHHTASEFAQDIFDLIIRQRYNLGLPTIITSNISMTEWAEVYGESMADFLYESSDVIEISHLSRRRRR